MLFAKYERLEIIYIDYIFNHVYGLKQNNKNTRLTVVSWNHAYYGILNNNNKSNSTYYPIKQAEVLLNKTNLVHIFTIFSQFYL